MSVIQQAVELIASNQHIAAPVVAFVVAYVLYGVLGKRYLGADDDFWEAIRKRLIPILDRVLSKSPLYVTRIASPNEFAAVVSAPVEEFEKELERMGYHRNPLASLKRNEQGTVEAGSWAKRDGRFNRFGSFLAKYVPFGGLGIGRFLSSLGEVFAVKQTHVMLFEDEGETLVYAHREFNSINPFTALLHYTGGGGYSNRQGIRRVRQDLTQAGISYRPKNLRRVEN